MATIQLKRPPNTATLEAYRRHACAARAATKPLLTFAVLMVVLMIGLFLCGLLHKNSLTLSLLGSVCSIAGAVPSIRYWHYKRSYPLELPQTVSIHWD